MPPREGPPWPSRRVRRSLVLTREPEMDAHRPTLASRAIPQVTRANWSVEQVYHAHYRRVHCLALRLLKNEADAEDVAQEVLLQVVRKLHTFRGDSALSTWLHRVTVNAAQLLRRQAHTRKQHLGPTAAVTDRGDDLAGDAAAAPDHLALRKELSQRIDQAIARLPADYRDVYLASEIDGLANAEISDRLGLSLAAVKSRLHRMRTMLRTMLSRYVEGLSA